ncbi:MAG: Vms1/Ankzf1 family peptidyl-tRNA hydrolase [Chloroflexi bacterium]|nr:Vms1/Ankzf1 family peptidyl-tRNA hydrolase [Chloroflexota bacterium]
MLELVERHSTSRARLRRLLDEIAAEGWCERTLYLTPASYEARMQDRRIVRPNMPDDDAMGVVAQTVGESDTGIALFIGDGRAVVVCPPFPFADDVSRSGFVASPLLRLLDREYVVGVVLLRLGRYAVGVVRGNKLIASKTAGRYMKNRHRAGGQSQRRFERSRERLIRELYDKTCEIANAVFEPYIDTIDHILLGGENSTLTGFADRCRLLRDVDDRVLSRRLAVDTPNRKALDNIAFEVWKSRVYSFQSVPESVETASSATERQ